MLFLYGCAGAFTLLRLCAKRLDRSIFRSYQPFSVNNLSYSGVIVVGHVIFAMDTARDGLTSISGKASGHVGFGMMSFGIVGKYP